MAGVRRSHAQRATRARPTTQIRAHKSAARITTTSESTVIGSGESGGGDEERFLVEDWRNLARDLIGEVVRER